MTLDEIKKEIEDGHPVYWKNRHYEVIKDSAGKYLIQHESGNCIGLTWTDGITLNGEESDFYGPHYDFIKSYERAKKQGEKYMQTGNIKSFRS